MKPENDFEELVTGKKDFEIPEFQRNYSWEKSHQRDLWRDLKNIGERHFFGTFILESTNHGHFRVIDGQQRLTTSIILLNEISRYIYDYDEEKAEEIRRHYIEGSSGGSKLNLMGDDKDFFNTYLTQKIELDKQKLLSKLDPDTPSQKRLYNCIRNFHEFFEDELKDNEKIESAKELSSFLKERYEDLETFILMAHIVESRSQGVKVFSITNDRGRGLTELEKTKSFLMEKLFQYFDETKEENELNDEIDLLRGWFQKMYNWVDEINDSDLDKTYSGERVQRFHYILWNDDWTGSYEKRYYSKSNRLQNLKTKFREKKEDRYLNMIEKYAKDLRSAFLSLNQLMLRKTENTKIDNDIESELENIFALGNFGNFVPLLITSFQKFEGGSISKKEFIDLLERIETFIFRVYTIKGKSTNTAKISIYKTSRDFYEGNKKYQDVIQDLDEEINDRASDDIIEEEFKDKNFYDNFEPSTIRCILYFFEKSKENAFESFNPPLLAFVKNDWDKKIHIEHIWPKSQEKLNLSEKELDEHEEYKHRLGNLAFLSNEWNIEQLDIPPQKKINPHKENRGYKNSKIRMLEEVADVVENRGWGKKQIIEREKEIIDTLLKDCFPDPKSN